jgi:hypothetical protein
MAVRLWRFVRRLVLLLVLIGLMAGIAAGVMTGRKLYKDGIAIKQRLDRVQALVSENKGQGMGTEMFTTLRQELSGGQQDFLVLKSDLQPVMPLFSHLGWLPKVGPSLQAVPHFLAMGESFLNAGGVLLDGVDPLLNMIQGQKTSASGDKLSITERMLPPLMAAQPQFVDAQDGIERAVAERQQIDSARLLSPLATQLDRLDKYLPALRTASQAAAVAPMLLGAARPMRYLILAQNNDELRATGGFITGMGVLTIDKGKIVSLDFKDSYSVDNWKKDHPQPPEPLERYMDSQLWVFRDANFWPDFPTSAKAAEFFAGLDMDFTPDGVIAVDQYALQILIGGMGSVVVPQYNNDVLTSDNAIAKIRSYWEPPTAAGGNDPEWYRWYIQRKQFMSYLVTAMRNKLETDTQSMSLTTFGKSVLEALDQKHILLYFSNPLGGGVADGAWGGVIPESTADYLFVVDANMGFNKANGVMKEKISYSINIDDGGLARSRLVVAYNNTSQRDVGCLLDAYYELTYDLMMNRCYWDYLRIYVPQGATLVGDENGRDMQMAGTENGKQVWASYIVIPPREKPQVAVGYYLPQPVLQKTGDAWEYRLLVQKQPGTDTTPLHVSVTMPAGTKVISASPAGAKIEGNMVTFDSDLSTDEEFRIVVK